MLLVMNLKKNIEMQFLDIAKEFDSFWYDGFFYKVLYENFPIQNIPHLLY